MRTFSVEFNVSARLEIDESIIDTVDDEWRSSFYDLNTPEEIVEMISRCMLAYHSNLSDLEGWADQPDKNARIIGNAEWRAKDIQEVIA